jgi:DNA-directed RNA polymerase I, II, and III subunit RPABC1
MSLTSPEFEYTEHMFEDYSIDDILRSARVVIEMLQDRGYRVEWKKEVKPSALTFDTVIQDLGLIGESTEKGLIQVFWSMSSKFLKEEAQYFIDEMNKVNSRRGIFIVSKEHTVQTKKLIKEQMKRGMIIQFFQIDELLVNFSRHVLIPKMRVLTPTEKKELLDRYQIEIDSQLPKMLQEDPIARYYGLEHQQVVMIQRNLQGDFGSAITYRIIQ